MADPDDPDLRERVAELEATVEAQQATIQQLLPSRRRVLQAGGLLAGGGVLGALTADRASADVVGQVGTQQDRVDVFGGTVDANSVNTKSAAIGSVDGSGETFRLTERRTPSSDTGQIQFSGLSDDVEYRIFYNTFIQGANDSAFLRVNGDGPSTGNYLYRDATATEQTNQDEFLLATVSNNSEFAGVITLTDLRYNTSTQPALNHRILPSADGRITDFGRGGAADSGSITSVELLADTAFGGGETVVELWERDYS